MKEVMVEHNLQDYELEEVLEKALGDVRIKIQRPARKFRQPAMEAIAESVTTQFGVQLRKMFKRIESVIRE